MVTDGRGQVLPVVWLVLERLAYWNVRKLWEQAEDPVAPPPSPPAVVIHRSRICLLGAPSAVSRSQRRKESHMPNWTAKTATSRAEGTAETLADAWSMAHAAAAELARAGGRCPVVRADRITIDPNDTD